MSNYGSLAPLPQSESDLELEQRLRQALETAWNEFLGAVPDQKAEARVRYLDALRCFREFAMPRDGSHFEFS